MTPVSDIDNGFARIDTFLSRTTGPIKNMADLTEVAVNQTADILTSTAWVIQGASSISSRALSYKTLYGSHTGFSFINTTMTALSTIITSKVGPHPKHHV